MPVGGITHGFGGFLKIGTQRVLCRRGAQLSMPRSLDIPYPISYQPFGQLNYADGLRFPVLSVPAIPMDMSAAGITDTPWFTAANLNAWFVTRSAWPVKDLAAISGGINFSDNGVVSGAGIGAFQVLNPKGSRFTLSVRKGQPLGFNMEFAGTDLTRSGVTAPTAGLQGTPLQSNAVTLGGSLASVGIIGCTLVVDNSLTPNMELDGTNRPVEHNADLMTARLTIEMNALAGVDCPGFDAGAAYTEISGTITVARSSGAGGSVVFTLNRGLLRNPDDRAQQEGRVIRSYTYDLIGTTTALPVAMADV